MYDLCGLLQLALEMDMYGGNVQKAFGARLDWEGIIELAASQGVLALAFEGMMKLPAEMHPLRKTKINWGVNVEMSKERNRYYLNVIRELALLFKKQGIEIMLLKGRGIALDYPNPFLREESDIDIYLMGKFHEGNDLLRKMGQEVISGYEKHAKFFYKGISIENHYFFLDSHSQHERLLESYLLACLTDNMDKYDLGEGAYVYLPSPDFNAVFLVKHAMNHLWRTETALRHLCDWRCFLLEHAKNIDFDKYIHILEETRLLHLADAFTALTVDRLGLDIALAPPFVRNKKIEKQLMRKVLKLPLQLTGHSIWDKFTYECKRLKEEQDVYSMFFSKSLFYRAKNKILRYI